MAEARARRRRPGYDPTLTALGGIVILLAIVGVVAVVVTGMRLTLRLLDKSDRIAQFEEFIQPVVMFDPIPFENAEAMDPDQMLMTAMWRALLSPRREAYSYDELGLIIVPASDLDVTAAELYGPDIKLTHRSFDDYEISYGYYPETRSYHLPLISKATYTPRVASVVSENSQLVLTVEYLAPGKGINQLSGESSEAAAEKTMLYILAEQGDGYRIAAVRDTQENLESPPTS